MNKQVDFYSLNASSEVKLIITLYLDLTELHFIEVLIASCFPLNGGDKNSAPLPSLLLALKPPCGCGLLAVRWNYDHIPDATVMTYQTNFVWKGPKDFLPNLCNISPG
jgi:hypothetical protein